MNGCNWFFMVRSNPRIKEYLRLKDPHLNRDIPKENKDDAVLQIDAAYDDNARLLKHYLALMVHGFIRSVLGVTWNISFRNFSGGQK